MTPTNQTRLMSAYDVKKGKMKMTFIKPTTQQPRTTTDFKRVDFEVLARDIHLIDQIELHKKTGEMIYSTLIGKAIVAHQFQNSLNNISLVCLSGFCSVRSFSRTLIFLPILKAFCVSSLC